MKILMVIDGLGKGGKERRMLELIKGLSRHKGAFEIYLVSLTDTVDYEYVYDLPITFNIIKRSHKKDLTVIFKLRRIIQSFKPDIIHCWSTMAGVFLAISNLFTKIPLINGALADANPHLSLSDKHYLRIKLTTPFTSFFVSNSLAGIQAYRTPPHKSVCIYNGIDLTRFENLKPSSEVEQEILGGSKENRFVAAMVATFDKRKDYETLVKAAVDLCSANERIIFLLIGTGSTIESIKTKVPLRLLDNQIFFLGRRDNIESLLQIVDVGLLITNADTHCEGVSNSIIEYMAMGKPVIASRGGGTDEVVKDDWNGYLIEPKNQMQLIERIEYLLLNKEKRKLLGKNAYEDARKLFDLDKKTDEYISLYQKLGSLDFKVAYNH